jgi:hypothetical protein
MWRTYRVPKPENYSAFFSLLALQLDLAEATIDRPWQSDSWQTFFRTMQIRAVREQVRGAGIAHDDERCLWSETVDLQFHGQSG